jgi:hypothetical protein
VLVDVPAAVNVGAFSVNLQEPRQFLSKKHGDLVSKLLETMLSYVRTNGSALLSSFSSLSKELVRVPKTVEVRVTLALNQRAVDACGVVPTDVLCLFDVEGPCGSENDDVFRTANVGQARHRNDELQCLLRCVGIMSRDDFQSELCRIVSS